MSLVGHDVPFTSSPTTFENRSNVLTLLQIFVMVPLWQVICGFFNLEDCSMPFLQIY